LIDLSIDHAELSNLPLDSFKSLSKLETLSMRHNRFKVIPLEEMRWLSQLRHIDLSGNPIVTINSNSFRHNSHLRIVTFRNMPSLAYVEDCAFCNIHELRTLEIANCSKLTDVDPEAFGRDNVYFKSIETIDLENNSLTTLDEDMLSWGNVSVIRLGGNPWECDCELLWMMDPKMKIDQTFLPVCDSPSAYKGKPVSKVRQIDSTFCMLKRISARIRTARLFLIVAILIIVSGVITVSWYLINNRRRNGLKLRNLFYKPQLPKYAYRNLAMGDEVEQDLPPGVVVNDGASIIPKNNKQNRDLASRLADES
jgi:Leucine-rich repeat (LRR) protein